MSSRNKERDKEKQTEEESESSNNILDQSAMIAAVTKLMDEKLTASKEEIKGKKKQDQSEPEKVHNLDPEPIHKVKDPRQKPADDEYYSGYGYSSRGSHRKSRRLRMEPDGMPENLNNYKMRVPQFFGKNDPYAYLDWEKKAELVFNYQKYYGVNCVKISTAEFYDYALSW